MNVFDKKQPVHINKQFNRLDLSKQELNTIEFDNCIFDECIFVESIFKKCKFIDCQFTDSNLSLIKVNASVFNDVCFKNSKIIGINWTTASWPTIKLPCRLKFHSCLLNNSTFFNLYLREIEIIECSAIDVDFRECNLIDANLQGTDLSKSLFIHCDMTHANFTNAENYFIDISLNKIKKAIFSLPEAINLLRSLDIELNDNS